MIKSGLTSWYENVHDIIACCNRPHIRIIFLSLKTGLNSRKAQLTGTGLPCFSAGYFPGKYYISEILILSSSANEYENKNKIHVECIILATPLFSSDISLCISSQ